MERVIPVLVVVFGLTLPASGLENGVARTPPMGWLAWERFQCNVDCARDPENCISERLFKEMAEILVSEGYRDAGYVYVNIDDCWSTFDRDANGRLQADPVRFPSGIKHLADFVRVFFSTLHQGRLIRGIRRGYVRSHYLIWEKPRKSAFTSSSSDSRIPRKTGVVPLTKRSLVRIQTSWLQSIFVILGRVCAFSCRSFVAFFRVVRRFPRFSQPNYKKIGQHCNLWRNYRDIADTWVSVEHTIDFYASIQTMLAEAAAPGRWNDPDMLIIGNFGLSYDQSKAQMALWAILAAPLLMSNDLRRMRPEFKQILLNKDIIAVNQDPFGIMGQKVQVVSLRSFLSMTPSPTLL
ncbi:unnamed protein product [Ixodes hexagonus]